MVLTAPHYLGAKSSYEQKGFLKAHILSLECHLKNLENLLTRY